MAELILIALLGHPNYEVRDFAQAAVVKLDYTGYNLARKFSKHPDREISRRCEEIISHYLHLPPCLQAPTGKIRFHNGEVHEVHKGKWLQRMRALQQKYVFHVDYSWEDGTRLAHGQFCRELLLAGAVKNDVLKMIMTDKPEPIKPPQSMMDRLLK